MKRQHRQDPIADSNQDLASSLARYSGKKPQPNERATAWDEEMQNRLKSSSRKDAETQRREVRTEETNAWTECISGTFSESVSAV